MIYWLSQHILDLARDQDWEGSVSWLRIFSYVTGTDLVPVEFVFWK